MNIAHKPPDNTKPKPGYDEAGNKCKEDIPPLHVHHCSEYILQDQSELQKEYLECSSYLHEPPVLVAHPVQLGVAVSRFRDDPSSLLPAQALSIVAYFQIWLRIYRPLEIWYFLSSQILSEGSLLWSQQPGNSSQYTSPKNIQGNKPQSEYS